MCVIQNPFMYMTLLFGQATHPVQTAKFALDDSS